MTILRAGLGVAAFCLLGWLLSSDRRRFPWRVVFYGVLLQVLLAWAILDTRIGLAVFQWISDGIEKLISMARPGAELVFGVLADPARMNEVFPGHGVVFAFTSSGLIVIIFFSALMSVLYHVGFMQAIVWVLARVMTATMGVSGAESLAMAANIFVGQTEAPLVIKPYLESMTQSELFCLMVGGFANIAGSVMAVYIGMLGKEYGPHLLTCSVMSAPAAFMLSKIIVPEREVTVTGGHVPFRVERDARNVIEAAANGTTDGLKLWLNVIAMLIAFTSLVALVDWPVGAVGEWLGIDGGLSLARIFGWLFAPIAWLTGVSGWNDCQAFGTLMGTKISINEFVAYAQLQDMQPGDPGLVVGTRTLVFHSVRNAELAAYALCGFANFASIGIQIGGISALVPSRKGDLARLAFKAMLGGAIATCMTAAIAGLFL